MEAVLGIIGGSGLYDLPGLERAEWRRVAAVGEPSTISFLPTWGKLRFLPRHAAAIAFADPHQLPRQYRRDERAASPTSCRSRRSVAQGNSAPGQFVLVDQFIDRTFAREKSFFGEGITRTSPWRSRSARCLPIACALAGMRRDRLPRGGTYIAWSGRIFRRLRKPLYRSWGCDVLADQHAGGKLAREAEISYPTIAMVTDYVCWHHEHEPVAIK